MRLVLRRLVLLVPTLLGVATLVFAFLPMLFLPAAASWPAIVFLYLTLGTVGYRLGMAKHEDLFGLVGIKPRAAGVTPSIRAACPSVAGRSRSSFWHASIDNPLTAL